MKIDQVLHMNEGTGQTSYAKNSLFQVIYNVIDEVYFFSILHITVFFHHMTMFWRNDIQQKAISLAKPIIEEAINSLYCSTLPRSLAIADLGCSSGPNTFFVVSEVIKSVEKLCRELNHPSPEYQVFMNDLPGNDFNSIFKSLGNFKQKLRNEMQAKIGPCYIAGAPGSFYGRIFPNKSLHFVHSSYSLHWLSQVSN